jgi:AcrR family transcriptional regulator
VPTPAKTSQADLIDIGLALATEGGSDAVTIAAVAQAAGVKGPSLYKHFADREALLTAIEIAVLHELETVLRQVKGRTPRQRIIAMARAYRTFGHTAPHRYGLVYRKNVADDPALAEACLFSAKPLFEALEAAGLPHKRILPVSRTLVAFLHGFVTMEIAQAFRLGGSLDEAFEAGLETVLREVEG